MRDIEQIKAEYNAEVEKAIETGKEATARRLRAELVDAITKGMSPATLETICTAWSEGRAVILPCRIGDIIYLADLDRELSIHAQQGIEELKSCFFRTSGNHGHTTIVCETRGESWYYLSELKLGKTAFFTYAQAEAVLKAHGGPSGEM